MNIIVIEAHPRERRKDNCVPASPWDRSVALYSLSLRFSEQQNPERKHDEEPIQEACAEIKQISILPSSGAVAGSSFIHQCLQVGILENLLGLGLVVWWFGFHFVFSLVGLARRRLDERSGWGFIVCCEDIIFFSISQAEIFAVAFSFYPFANHQQLKVLTCVPNVPCLHQSILKVFLKKDSNMSSFFVWSAPSELGTLRLDQVFRIFSATTGTRNAVSLQNENRTFLAKLT